MGLLHDLGVANLVMGDPSSPFGDLKKFSFFLAISTCTLLTSLLGSLFLFYLTYIFS